MRRIAFFGVAAYERPILEAATFPDGAPILVAEPLDAAAAARVRDVEVLCEALHAGRLGGAGLDVFEGEDLVSEEAELLHRPLTMQ